jgi:hypothetical protein
MPQTRSKTAAAKGGGKSQSQDGSHDSALDEELEEEPEHRGRGRPAGSTRAEDYWTRVLSPGYRQIDFQAKFNIKTDMENEQQSWQEVEEFRDNISWPIFLPDEWAKELGELKKEDWALKEE